MAPPTYRVFKLLMPTSLRVNGISTSLFFASYNFYFNHRHTFKIAWVSMLSFRFSVGRWKDLSWARCLINAASYLPMISLRNSIFSFLAFFNFFFLFWKLYSSASLSSTFLSYFSRSSISSHVRGLFFFWNSFSSLAWIFWNFIILLFSYNSIIALTVLFVC